MADRCVYDRKETLDQILHKISRSLSSTICPPLPPSNQPQTLVNCFKIRRGGQILDRREIWCTELDIKKQTNSKISPSKSHQANSSGSINGSRMRQLILKRRLQNKGQILSSIHMNVECEENLSWNGMVQQG